MTKIDKIKNLNKLEEIINKIDKMIDIIGIDIEGPLYNLLYDPINITIDLMIDSFGISEDSLTWFIYENEFGKKGYSCYYNDKEYKITNAEEFLDFESLIGD